MSFASLSRHTPIRLYTGGAFTPNRTTKAPLSDAALRGLVTADLGFSLTFTCVPPGSGWRIAIDRDGDGYPDGDELAAGVNPADPASTP